MPARFDRLPPLAALRPFEAAARHASFKRAAAELSLSQAAISRQIRRLEEDLGRTLFERHHRHVRLTGDGQQLADAVSRGLIEIASAAQGLRVRRPKGQVILRIELYLAMYWLVPRLAGFQAAHPNIRIQLAATTTPLDQAVDPFDLAIQSTERPCAGREPVATAPEAIIPVCSPAFASPGSLTLQELADQPRASFQQIDGDSWTDWSTWFPEAGWHGQHAPPTEVFDSYPVMIQALLAGRGIGLGWTRGVGDLLESGSLVNPVKESIHRAEGIGVFIDEGAEPSPATMSVVRWLGECLREPLATDPSPAC